jgi:hypothetical protein
VIAQANTATPETLPAKQMILETDLLLDAGIGWAHRGTLGFIEMAFALHAEFGVDHIILVTLGDGLDRADRFASAAADAGISNC